MTTANRIPPVRYMLLFPGRTGSTYLTDHLAAHPQIIAQYEILSAYQESWERQQAFLDEWCFQSRSPQIHAVGMKTKLRDIADLSLFEDYLKKHQFRMIYLSRNNPLKFIISIVRAEQLRQKTGSSNLIDNSHEPLGATTIALDQFSKAKTRLRRENRIAKLIDSLGLPTLELYYEDFLRNEQQALKRVWDFLEVNNIATVARTRKNTPSDIRQVVINLDEIISHHPEMAPFVNAL